MRYVRLIETDSLGRFDPNNPLAYNVVMNEIPSKFRSEKFIKYAAMVIVLALTAYWLASCSPLVGDGGRTPTMPLPNTETLTATATATPTETPTPSPTATITETPTPEIVQFPVCAIENFRECPITLEDIYNGNVDRWLETQKKPFDLAKMKNVELHWYDWDRIQYNFLTFPNFTDPSTAQQHRGIAMDLNYEKDGVQYEYILLPLEFYDPLRGCSHWVKTVYPIYKQGKSSAKSAEDWGKKYWEDMNFNPIVTSNVIPNTAILDPLVGATFQNHLDMGPRFNWFASGKDMSTLSEADIILLTSVWTGGQQFK